MKDNKKQYEALLLSEYVAILEWLRDSVKVDAGGHIPLGVCTVNTTNLAANFSTGDMVGTALGVRVELDTALANGARKFVDSDGTTISIYP